MKTIAVDNRAGAATRSASSSSLGWLVLSTVLLLGLLLSAGTARGAIEASLERPASNFPASGIGNVQGWAFSTTPGAKINRLIEVQIDADPSFKVPCCSSRGDVKQVFPNAPIQSGFSGVFNFQRLAAGLHQIKVTIQSSALESNTITSSFEVVKLSSYKMLRSFYWQDHAEQGCESVNGLDPAHGNAGVVCNLSHAVSKQSGNPVESCDGTFQFAFDRGTQTLQPVTGCDPQGSIGDDDDGGGGGGSKFRFGVVDPSDGLTCLPNAVQNLSVSVVGITPTFYFGTKLSSRPARSTTTG